MVKSESAFPFGNHCTLRNFLLKLKHFFDNNLCTLCKIFQETPFFFLCAIFPLHHFSLIPNSAATIHAHH